MFDMTRWYELSLLLHASSVLFYFIDFLHHNRKANRIAFGLLSIVWGMQTFFFFARMVETERFPVLTLAEGLSFYAWLLITLSLAINGWLRVDFLVFFTNVLAFFILSLHTFAPTPYTVGIAEQLMSELLFIHITMAILSYGAFSISFMFSLLYLLQYELLKKKKWGKRLWRLGDLAKLDDLSYVLNGVGVPVLLLSLILGIVWAYMKVDHFVLYDAKVLGSFTVFATYSFYLYKRAVKGIQGKEMALWNIGSFLILLINFFLFGTLSQFHF
ncbi:cytochrome C assembly family protein [Anoxybacillus sp. TBDG-1]